METKVEVLVLGILVLLTGFIMLLLLAPLLLAETETDVYVPDLVTFGAFFFIVGINMTFIGLIEVATDKASLQERKKKIVSIALIVIAIGAIVPYSVWALLEPIYTPNWTFTLTTDRFAYELGEPVQINVTLENHGSVGHWFISCSSNPVIVKIMRGEPARLDWNRIKYSNTVIFASMIPTHDRITKFMIPASQSLRRTFIWNQTNNIDPDPIEPDTYTIHAYIPLSLRVGSRWIGYSEESTFTAEKIINITST